MKIRFIEFTLCIAFFCVTAFSLDVNVRSRPYNAAGDGMTNDRIAIQKAINDVSAARGGTVILPSGYTFLSGEIQLKSNVTLQIDGTLKQSNIPSHFAHPTIYGRFMKGSSQSQTGGELNWPLASYYNYPLIYTERGTTNVAIKGTGTIEMSYTGDDDTTIQIAAIGFFETEQFIIRDITIHNACQPQIWPVQCRYGEVANVTIEDSATVNSEAICMCNCQNIHIHHNNSVCMDDNIDVWVSYKDARMGVWCNTDDPQPSINIEIDHNTLRQVTYASNINLIPWGSGAPDQNMVRMDNIYIHDNTLLGGDNGNAKLSYQEFNTTGTYGHSPISNVRIINNGIGDSTKHDGAEPKFPCIGFETNDIIDPWFTNAISPIVAAVEAP